MAFVAFVLLFLFHIYPIGLSDVYWHLNTGRWIWEHSALPTSDPFTYTLGNTLDDRQRLILHGYWLAQLLFFAVHAVLGMWGLVILKATLFVTLYFLVWRTLLRVGVNPILGLIAILILPWLLFRYDELRPQVFSFIGVVLVYMSLSRALEMLRNSVVNSKVLIALPLIMLVWANLHPGFILGWVIITVVLAGVIIDQWRGVNKLSRLALQRLFSWCGLALLVSLINPTGDLFIINIIDIQHPLTREVDEYLPLAEYAQLYQQPLLFYGVLALTLSIIGGAFCRWRQITLVDALLFIGFAVAGFCAFRYMIFFVLIGMILGMPHISILMEQNIDKAKAITIVMLLVVMSGVGYLVYQRNFWVLGASETIYVPEQAAEFIRTRHPPAPLFNAYEYGGYLGWQLTPEYRMFIDPRTLDDAAQVDYQTARGGHYQKAFQKYGVNSVAFYIFTPVIGSIPEVSLYLLMDTQWDLVYVDKLSVVLVRHAKNTLPIVDKAPLLDYLQRVLERTLTTMPNDTQAMVQYGRVLYFRGDVEGAKQRFRNALQINPRLRAPRFYLDAIAHQGK
jgi:hypothetical protein